MKKNQGLLLGIFLAGTIASCAGDEMTIITEGDVRSTTKAVIAGAETDETKLERVFLFVRDRIEFNWVYPQDIPAEDVWGSFAG